jgi:hypothetical protein
MRLLYRIEMPPSNRLGINDNEDHERSPGRLQYQPRSAPPSHGAPVHSRSLYRGPGRFLLSGVKRK